MAGSPKTTDCVVNLSRFLSNERRLWKWYGSLEQLKSFLDEPPLSWEGEWNSQAGNVHQFKLNTPPGLLRFFQNTGTLQIRGEIKEQKHLETLLRQQTNQSANQQRSPAAKTVPVNKRKTRDSGESRLDDLIAINTTTGI